MPQVSYFLARANAYMITGADATDLIIHSTVTHQKVRAALAHPPHSHAHIAKEGFEVPPIVPLSVKETIRFFNLKNKPKATRTSAETSQLEQLSRRQANLPSDYGTEGKHLDPATRGAYADPLHEVVDGNTKYIDRKLHSQFEDSEIAVMALVYALNTDAGKAALNHLTTANTRIVLHSLSAANALKAGPVPLNNPPAALSHHPMRGVIPQVVLRGKGPSGKAGDAQYEGVKLPPSMPIAATTLVLDSNGTELTLVTHYPTHQKPQARYKDGGVWVATTKAGAPKKKEIVKDTIEFTTNQVLQDGQQYLVKYASATAPVPIKWGLDEPMINLPFGMKLHGVKSAGLACVTCGQVHGVGPSIINKWFQCNQCGAPYCPTHAVTLDATPPAGKVCKVPYCTGVAIWIY